MTVTILRSVPRYTVWWQRHIGVNNLPKVVRQLCSGGNWTHDLLIASPTSYRYMLLRHQDYSCSVRTARFYDCGKVPELNGILLRLWRNWTAMVFIDPPCRPPYIHSFIHVSFSIMASSHQWHGQDKIRLVGGVNSILATSQACFQQVSPHFETGKIILTFICRRQSWLNYRQFCSHRGHGQNKTLKTKQSCLVQRPQCALGWR